MILSLKLDTLIDVRKLIPSIQVQVLDSEEDSDVLSGVLLSLSGGKVVGIDSDGDSLSTISRSWLLVKRNVCHFVFL